MLNSRRFNQEIRRLDDGRIYFIQDHTMNIHSMYEYIVNVHPVAGVVSGSGPVSALRFRGLSNIASSNTETMTMTFTPPITIDFWFKIDTIYTQTYAPIILSETAGLGFPAARFCAFGPVRATSTANSPILLEILGIRFVPNNGVIQDNTWIHCQFLLPGSGGLPTCRINGVQLITTETQVYPPTPPVPFTSGSATLNGETYTVTSSSVSSSTTPAFRAFEGNDTNDWRSGATTDPYLQTTGVYNGKSTTGTYLGAWLQIQLPFSIVLSGYTIRSSNTTWQDHPRSFKVFGSNDGTSWDELNNQPGVSFTAANQTLTFTLTSTSSSAYSYYRLAVNAVPSGRTTLRINEFRLIGTGPIRTPPWVTNAHRYIQIRTAGGIEFGNIRLSAGNTPVAVENDPVPDANRTIVLLKGHVTPELTIPSRCSIAEDVEFVGMGTTSKSHVWSGWYNIPRNLQTLTALQSNTTFDCRVVIGRPSEPASLGDMMFAPRFTNTYTNTYSSNVTLPINIIHAPATKFAAIQFNSSNISRSEMRSGCVPYTFRLEQNGRTLKLDTDTNEYDWDNGMRDGIFITSNAIPYNSLRDTAIGVGSGTLTLAQVNRPGSNVTCLCMQDAVTLRTCAFNANGKLVLLNQPGKQRFANTMMHMTFSNIWNPGTNRSLAPILFRALQ